MDPFTIALIVSAIVGSYATYEQGRAARQQGRDTQKIMEYNAHLKELEAEEARRAGKVEAEHAAIWRKILKLDSVPEGNEPCHTSNKENLEESHQRETNAIEFYKKAAAESENERVKQIFIALIEVETDHLKLSEERL